MRGSRGVRKTIHVLLVDESMLTLHGLKAFVSKSKHIEVAGIATTCGEALIAIQTHRPDVVMLEVDMGGMSGIDLCKTIRQVHPNIGVLVFTAHDDKDLLRAAILAGAQGYLLKTAAADAVTKSIEIVATGQAILDQQLTQHVITWVKDKGLAASGTVKGSCSRDDLRLLAYVASGKTNKEIAVELDVTPTVVATRLQRIYKRLKISRRSEAARYYAHLAKGFDQ
jgi:two-component system response regulator DevR